MKAPAVRSPGVVSRVLLVALVLPRVAPGGQGGREAFRYHHLAREGPVSIHLLEVDPARAAIRLECALNSGIGRETVSSMARRNGAVAAVNGGYFRMGGRYDGEATGVLRIENMWISDSELARAALGWTRQGVSLIDRLQVRLGIEIGERAFPVHGLNRERGSGEAVLYNAAFHRSTLTDPSGTETLISGGRVREVRSGGDSPIPAGGLVYSAGPRLRLPAPIRVDDPFAVTYAVRPENDPAGRWEEMEYIVGGTPQLIDQGRPLTDFTAEKVAADFVENRHPRTAACIRGDGSWLLVVVDGRQPDLSVGMTLAELRDFLLEQECIEALNLDGGGSSTFYLEGKVRNTPSDFGKERPVSDAILVLTRP